MNIKMIPLWLVGAIVTSGMFWIVWHGMKNLPTQELQASASGAPFWLIAVVVIILSTIVAPIISVPKRINTGQK